MKIEISDYDLITAAWFKSSYSGGDGGNCLEISCSHPGVVPVRDSKVPDGAKLLFRTGAWSVFVDALK